MSNSFKVVFEGIHGHLVTYLVALSELASVYAARLFPAL